MDDYASSFDYSQLNTGPYSGYIAPSAPPVETEAPAYYADPYGEGPSYVGPTREAAAAQEAVQSLPRAPLPEYSPKNFVASGPTAAQIKAFGVPSYSALELYDNVLGTVLGSPDSQPYNLGVLQRNFAGLSVENGVLKSMWTEAPPPPPPSPNVPVAPLIEVDTKTVEPPYDPVDQLPVSAGPATNPETMIRAPAIQAQAPATRAQAADAAAVAAQVADPEIAGAQETIAAYKEAGGKLSATHKRLSGLTEESWNKLPNDQKDLYLAQARSASDSLPSAIDSLNTTKAQAEDSKASADRNKLSSAVIKAGPGVSMSKAAEETYRQAGQAYDAKDYARANRLYSEASSAFSQASANPKAVVGPGFFSDERADGSEPLNFGNITMFVGLLGSLFTTLYSQPKAAKDQMAFQERMAQRQFEQQKELISMRQGGSSSSSGKGAGPAATAAPSLANARYTT